MHYLWIYLRSLYEVEESCDRKINSLRVLIMSEVSLTLYSYTVQYMGTKGVNWNICRSLYSSLVHSTLHQADVGLMTL
jgi:hypothetical protein